MHQIKFSIPQPKFKIGDCFQDNAVWKSFEECTSEPLDEDDKEWLEDAKKYKDFKVVITGYYFSCRFQVADEIGTLIDGSSIDLSNYGCFVYALEPLEHHEYDYTGGGDDDMKYEEEMSELCEDKTFEILPHKKPLLSCPDIQLGDIFQKWMEFPIDEQDGHSWSGIVEDNFRVVTGFRIHDFDDPALEFLPIALTLFAGGEGFYCGDNNDALYHENDRDLDIKSDRKILIGVENPCASYGRIFEPPGIVQQI
jgi:hypothetical protein